MTRAISHDDAFATLEALAVDALDEQERRDVLAHAATCTECAAALAELRATAASLAYTAPRIPLSPERSAAIRSRLLDRAATDAAIRTGGTPPASWLVPTQVPRGDRRWTGAGLLALAACVAFLASVALLARTWRERDRLRAAVATTLTNQTALTTRLDSLRAVIAADERMLSSMTGPRVRVLDLTAGGARPPVGRMFWDQPTN